MDTTMGSLHVPECVRVFVYVHLRLSPHSPRYINATDDNMKYSVRQNTMYCQLTLYVKMEEKRIKTGRHEDDTRRYMIWSVRHRSTHTHIISYPYVLNRYNGIPVIYRQR